jgi:hypothetical protein
MDITWQVILIGLILVGAVLLIIAYIWVFIIQQSPLRLIIMVLRSALNRDRLVDENAPIEARKEAFRSQAFTAQTEALKDEVIGNQQASQRPHAVLPADELIHKPDETTTDSGWPLDPSQEEHGSARPFLKANYRTHNEDVQEQQGNL